MVKGAIVKVEPSGDQREAAGEGWRLRWVPSDMTPLFVFFFILLLLQMVPMPQGLVVLISPEAKIVAETSQPPTAGLTAVAAAGRWQALSPYLFPVRMSLVRWTVYGLLFFGLLNCLNSKKRIEAAIGVLLLLAFFDALYGIMETYSKHGHVLWFKDSTYAETISGTYLNRNHFSSMMAMAIILVIAYVAALDEGDGDRGHPFLNGRSLKKRFLAIFSEKSQHLRRFLIVFAGAVMGLALGLSGSRGGIISMAGGLLLMGLVFFFRKKERKKGRIILLLFGIAMVFALHAGLDYTIGRFEFFDRSLEERKALSETALELFKDYQWTGVGLGNFRHAYGKYQTAKFENYYVDYAHNDYAQFLAEAGVVGAVLLIFGVGWYAVRTLRIWQRRTSSYAICLGIAPFAALFALAIHSLSDYNLHRPANVMVLIAVTAIGTAALHLENGGRRGRMHYPVRSIPLRPWGGILAAGAVGLILWCGVWTVRNFIAETYCNTENNITLNLDANPPVERLQKAAIWNPDNAVYPFKHAQALMTERDTRMQGPKPDAEGWRQSHGPIIAQLERAIRLNPMNPEYHVRLGWEYSYLFDRPDFLTRWLPAADICLDRGAWFAGKWSQNPLLHDDIRNYWAMRAKTLEPGSAHAKAALAKGK
jgi:O-antigen ligase